MRPSWASRVKTGRKLSVMINSEKNKAGPTSLAASLMIRHLFSSVRGSRSICLWTFSIITMAASTMAPTAMAMPPNDMMLALMPCRFMTMNAHRMPIGRLITMTSAERM